MNLTALIVIGAYLVGMVLVGFYFSKKTSNASEYFLGDRKLGPFVTAMSAEASDMSGWLLMGLPGLALTCGLAEASWTAIGLGIGTYINWLIVAKRLRIYSQKINAVTVPEFFSKRFGDDKGILSLISALVIVIFFVPYTASGFNACGTLFTTLSGGKISYLSAMIVSAVVIIAYTTLGGFLAASTTDLIQSIVMSIALVVVVFFGIQYAGGWENVVTNARNLPDYLKLTSTYDIATGGTSSFSLLDILSTLAWGLGYCGMPHILLRFMAINDSKKLTLSRRIASVWVIIAMGIAIFIGVIGCGAVNMGDKIVLDPANGEGQRIIVEIARVMSENGLGFAILAGIILAGILASTMSTSDSQLLAAASSVSQDFLVGFLKLKISNKVSMIISRLSIVVISVIAIFLARKENSVFEIVSFAWAGFGAAFGPVIIVSLFWKKANKWGALAGMITGGAMVFIWKYVIAKPSSVLDIYELLPAFIFAVIAIVVVSLITGKPSKQVEEDFDEVKELMKQA